MHSARIVTALFALAALLVATGAPAMTSLAGVDSGRAGCSCCCLCDCERLRANESEYSGPPCPCSMSDPGDRPWPTAPPAVTPQSPEGPLEPGCAGGLASSAQPAARDGVAVTQDAFRRQPPLLSHLCVRIC